MSHRCGVEFSHRRSGLLLTGFGGKNTRINIVVGPYDFRDAGNPFYDGIQS